MPPPDRRVDEALVLAAEHARETEERLAAAERLLAAERAARRADLEDVLMALGEPIGPAELDVTILARAAATAAARLLRTSVDKPP